MRGPSYPIEHPKPFDQRADKAIHELEAMRDSVAMLFGEHAPLVARILNATGLLREAVARGVKGQEADHVR